MASLALLSLLLSAAPDGGAPPKKVADLDRVVGISAPFGRIGDVVEPPPEGGLPGQERILVTTLEGCDRPQAIYVSRFLSGALHAAGQVQEWLERKGEGAPTGLERRIFGRPTRLVEAVRKARRAAPHDGGLCEGAGIEEGWRLALAKAPGKLCAGAPPGAAGGTFAFVEPGRKPLARALAALVQLSPGREGAPDRCRPRISVVLFDEAGTARFRYHADYGGVLSAELLGDRCQAISLAFDATSETFRPLPLRGCPKGKPR